MIFRFTKRFTAEFKKLLKKYNHAEDDFDYFVSNFETHHQAAITIKANIYKARIKNFDKNRGKSAGYRTYYYIVENETVYFLTIYDKSEKESIDESVLDEIISTDIG